jgi:hypothetical protein
MGTIIKKINLCNWFNYAGDYDQNEILLNKGVNFFCADNNAGKSKLHNALRWILADTVILKNEEVQLNSDTLTQIVNQQYFQTIDLGKEFRFGVQVETEKEQGNNTIRRKILKEVRGYKDSSFRIISEVYIPGRGGGWTLSTESFEEKNQFIPRKFFRYLFLEGEQINELIPFQGPELKNTINSLTNINSIDNLIDKSSKIIASCDEELTSLVKSSNKDNDKIDSAIKRKTELESNLLKHEETISPLKLELEKYQADLTKLKTEAQSAKERQKVIKKIEEFDRLIKSQEALIEEKINQYYSLISREFKISGFIDSSTDNEFLNDEYRNILLTLQSNRKAELDSSIDEVKQKMVARLIKNQPGIEILNEILDGGKCFVCGTDPISKSSKEYIENHLIPHFNGSNKVDDNELNLYDAINQLINNTSKVNIAFNINIESFDVKINEISEARKDLDSIIENKRRYIDNNGDYSNSDDPSEFLAKFEKLNNNLNNTSKSIDALNIKIEDINKEIIECNKDISIKSENENPKIDKLRKLMEFQKTVTSRLKTYKENIYHSFCTQLADSATKRLHKYFGENPGIKDKKFEVKFTNDGNKEYSFSIGVYNKYGSEVTDPGGAESSIRQYCVVLSLLEIAKKNNASIGKFPFIVDAPISNLNSEYRFNFYRTLLDEDVNVQMIILTYDLVQAAPESKINSDGMEIYHLMNSGVIKNAGNMLFKKDYMTPVVVFNVEEN